MTIWYPDVSNHEGAMPLASGTVACFAKASEGTGYADPFYAHFKAEAARVGALFGAYHFLKQGNAAAQARFAFSIVGPGVPMMIDFEPEYDANGNPVSLPTIADAIGFRDTYRQLGGLVRLNYLPRWYWQQLGSPSLAPLADLVLVASDYTTYSDTGPGWAPYGPGEPEPGVWQYTDKLPYSGQQVDFNAFRGTIEEFSALLHGGDMPLTTADAQLVANTLLDTPIQRQGHNSAGQPLTGEVSLRTILAWMDAGGQHTQDAIAAVGAAVAKLAQPAAPSVTVDAAQLAAALVGNAEFVAAIAHAIGVELHHDTPAT
jgi:hypothetical protein